jgi:hypothetical protein
VTESAQQVESEVNELRTDLLTLRTTVLTPPAAISVPTLDSLIIEEFPSILPDLGQKSFQLLWRSNRDGLQASTFHNCCDGHANTLTSIEDTNGNIFGGYSPQTWESRECSKTDASHKSILFTLTNR